MISSFLASPITSQSCYEAKTSSKLWQGSYCSCCRKEVEEAAAGVKILRKQNYWKKGVEKVKSAKGKEGNNAMRTEATAPKSAICV